MDCPGVLWVVGVNLGNGLAGVTGGAGALIEGAGVLEGGAGVLEGGAEVLEEGAEELMGGVPYLPPSFFLHKIFKVHPSARFGKYCPLGTSYFDEPQIGTKSHFSRPNHTFLH